MTGTDDRSGLTRRQLLGLAALGSAAVVAGGAAVLRPWEGEDEDERRPAPQPVRARSLVVVDLGGGNDGWSTHVPFEHGGYRDLRPSLALGADEVIDLGGGWGLNRRLGRLHERGLAILEGVGTAHPELSHFDMADRWSRGNPDPVTTSGPGETGFLGSLCDAIGRPDRLSGLSIQWGDPLALRTSLVPASAVADLENNPLQDRKVNAQFAALLRAFTADPPEPRLRAGWEQVAGTAAVMDLFRTLPAATGDYPDTALGRQLALAAQLLRSGGDIRVVHVPMDRAAFDTHAKHRSTHDALMDELDGALGAFYDELAEAGDADRVLVATTSEFGRRPRENDGGLDHGAAAPMLLLGPVAAGLHGEPSPLDRFDHMDNLIATVEFDRYYATLAAWMDVDPDQVLPRRTSGRPAAPLDGLLA